MRSSLFACALLLAFCASSTETASQRTTAATIVGAQRTGDGDDGGKIVFVRDSATLAEIDVIHADGPNERRLTNNNDSDTHPAWSPDGERIVFVSERDAMTGSSRSNAREIYVMNADGTGVVRLTRNSAADFHPQWSPDGTRIVFWSDRDGNPEIYVMNADGSKQERLTSHPAVDRTGGWSPDGRRIVFHSERDNSSGPTTETAQADVYVMNADGTNVVRLTTHPARDMVAAWSPDGRQIAFTSRRDGNNEIFVMNADGSDQRQLTHNDSEDLYAVWSPNGRRIAFFTNRDGNDELYLMAADGSDQRRLTTYPGDDTLPSWGAVRPRRVR